MRSYFMSIRYNFGDHTCRYLKDFRKLTAKEIKILTKIWFLKECLRYKLIPPHFNFLFDKIIFQDYLYNNRYHKANIRYINNIIKYEIRDAYKTLRLIRKNLRTICGEISFALPNKFLYKFYNKQEISNNNLWNSQINKMDKKIQWLQNKKTKEEINKIIPIQYHYSAPTEQVTTQNIRSGYSLLRPENITNNYEICIPAKNFNNLDNIYTLHNEWFKDLTDIYIPNEVKLLLQLGEGFSVPINDNNKNKILIEFIKYIEHNIWRATSAVQMDVRNKAVSLLKNFYSSSIQHKDLDNIISQWLRITKKFINENPDILFVRADKGNITIAIKRSHYLDKVNELLSDAHTYESLKKDPIKKLTDDVRTHLVRWKNKNFIGDRKYKELLVTDGFLPRAYGLPKIHKTGIPFRLIVSSIGSPLYKLANFFHYILIESVPKSESFIKNSFELVNKLGNIEWKQNYELLSLDVISLFTNIPIDLAINSISNRWEYISQNTTFTEDEFLIGIRFILNSTYFSFNNKFYKQTFGSPMGSPLSPIIADLTLQDLEIKILSSLLFRPLFYYRYVDDILCAVPEESIEMLINTFNSYHNRLQFTIEKSEQNKINFLDTEITIINNNLIMDWYHKPTFSGRFLNFHSQHPLSHKIGVIYGLVDRYFFISHPQFHTKNLIDIINILLKNSYPINFIFYYIKKKVKISYSKKQ